MSYATGFHQAASLDAVRISQSLMHRDVQTQTIAGQQIAQANASARRVPRANEPQRHRGRLTDGEDREAPAEESTGRGSGLGRRFDRVA